MYFVFKSIIKNKVNPLLQIYYNMCVYYMLGSQPSWNRHMVWSRINVVSYKLSQKTSLYTCQAIYYGTRSGVWHLRSILLCIIRVDIKCRSAVTDYTKLPLLVLFNMYDVMHQGIA